MADTRICEVEGGYTIADDGGWLPGVYATREVAERAATFDISALEKLTRLTGGRIYPGHLDRIMNPHDSYNQIDLGELVPGQRYRVSWSDCCAEGWFEGIFVKGDSDALDDLEFDCGVVSTVTSGQMWVTPVQGR